MAGFPRCAAFVFFTLLLFYVLAWPFAIPLHFVAWLSGVNVARQT